MEQHLKSEGGLLKAEKSIFHEILLFRNQKFSTPAIRHFGPKINFWFVV